MARVMRLAAVAALLAVAFLAGWLASGVGVGRRAPAASLEGREAAFSERMRGVVLDGRFTVAWPEPRDGDFGDRYEIASVEKLDGNRWRFNARVVYGRVDVTVPVVVPVEWAGNVPVVVLKDAELPGLGEEFSAVVAFDEDRYAGTWDHGEVGGFMYGRIEPHSGEETPEE